MALGVLVAPTAAAQPPAENEPPGEPPSVHQLTLEELMDIWVTASLAWVLELQTVTATKELRAVREAPSILAVVSRDEIRQWGFNSVAEALTLVPGLYCIDDYLAPDCGVRGITGGQRGYSKILKVMIDGQPVSFRADGTNYLGAELCPIEVVERIEVVRGPVSPLYGANAFFGAINVITRKREHGTGAGARVRASDDLGAGLGGAVVSGGDWWSATLGGSLVFGDYDGRRLPGSSPNRLLLVAAGRELRSRNAEVRPRSALGHLRLRTGDFESELLARYGHLDTVAEFLDFGTLTHDNRVALDMLDARLQTRWTPRERLSLTASLAHARGGIAGNERLSTGVPATRPRRELGYRAWDLLLEGHLLLFENDTLTLGVDRTRDREKLIETFSVDRATGASTRTSAAAGHRTLTNTGLYVQGLLHPTETLGLAANLRHDRHTIYGGATNYRLGAIWTPRRQLTAKLLYGTSFRAPAALQLFAQPLFPGEAIGNAELAPETARHLEAEVLWRPAAELTMRAAGFWSDVRDKVEVQPVVANLQPVNGGRQQGRGGEVAATWQRGPSVATASGAYQYTDTVITDPFLGDLAAPSERYPRLVAQLRLQHRHPIWGTPGAALRYVSPRRASLANIRENLQVAYELPAYVSLDLAYFGSWGRHAVQVRLDNVLDADNAEPGFGGFDLPRRGRRAMASYSFGL